MLGTIRKMVEFLESCIPVFPDDEDLDMAIKEGRELIDQLREAHPTAQPAQHWHDLYKAKCQELHDERARLGAQIEALENEPAQPKREWVGLTESDRRLINFQWQDGNGTATEIIDLVEAKLKEKNT